MNFYPMEERYKIEFVSDVLRAWKQLPLQKRLEHAELAIKELAYQEYVPLSKQPLPKRGDLTRWMLKIRQEGLQNQCKSVKWRYNYPKLPN